MKRSAKADNTPRTLAQAFKEVLNIDYNGRIRSNVLGDSSRNEQGRQSGSNRDAATKPRAIHPIDGSNRKTNLINNGKTYFYYICHRLHHMLLHC